MPFARGGGSSEGALAAPLLQTARTSFAGGFFMAASVAAQSANGRAFPNWQIWLPRCRRCKRQPRRMPPFVSCRPVRSGGGADRTAGRRAKPTPSAIGMSVLHLLLAARGSVLRPAAGFCANSPRRTWRHAILPVDGSPCPSATPSRAPSLLSLLLFCRCYPQGAVLACR